MRWFWIDRFTEFVSGSHAAAVKNVSLAEEHLHDHFPGYPVMPGSLIVEGMAQTGGLLVSESYRFDELVVLGKIAKCDLEGLVLPGDRIEFRCKVEQLKEGGAMVSVSGHSLSQNNGERRVADAEIFFARIEEQAEKPKRSLFARRDLYNWLNIVGVFDVGRTPGGERLTPQMYGFLE
jgi:3-hydroxyacyl-[acyl-carrier-protein] dehydratase